MGYGRISSIIFIGAIALTGIGSAAANNQTKETPKLYRSCVYSPVKATSFIHINFNLYAGHSIPDNPFDPTDPSSFNYSIMEQVFDSLGMRHNLFLYFVKQSENTFAVHVEIDGALWTVGNLQFNTNGQLLQVKGLDNITWTIIDGAESPQILNVDVSCSTQTSSPDQVISVEQDGHNKSMFLDANSSQIYRDKKANQVCTIARCQATTEVKMNLNLRADDFSAGGIFSPESANTYNFKQDVIVYDSLGAPYKLTFYYVKEGLNIWNVYIYMYRNKIGAGRLVFNTNGMLQSASGMEELSWVPYSGAQSPQLFSIDFTCSTQYSDYYKVIEVWQNGKKS